MSRSLSWWMRRNMWGTQLGWSRQVGGACVVRPPELSTWARHGTHRVNGPTWGRVRWPYHSTESQAACMSAGELLLGLGAEVCTIRPPPLWVPPKEAALAFVAWWLTGSSRRDGIEAPICASRHRKEWACYKPDRNVAYRDGGACHGGDKGRPQQPSESMA